MDLDNLPARCVSQSPRRAILKGYRFRTNYYSNNNHGAGAANIEVEAGSEVEGVLMEMNDDGMQAIRRKEGAGKCYEEIVVQTLDGESGKRIEAVTFTVLPDRRALRDLPVTKDYRERILRAAKRFGLGECYQAMLANALVPKAST